MERQAIELCFATLATQSKSFALASRLLPRRARTEAAVLYAWCRRADDAIDLVEPAAAPAALARLRVELAGVYAGEPQQDLVLAAFQEVVLGRGVPRDYADELLMGMEMDATGVRYRSLDDLLLYCFRVAGTVGLMMCHVLGVRDAAALRRAAHLGIAMQLTNICRDVAEDWSRSRLYLPAELVTAEGGGELAPTADAAALDAAAPVLGRVVRRLLALADEHYASGDVGARDLPLRGALAVRTARLVYAAIGARVARRGFDVLAPRAFVPTVLKLALVARALVATLAEVPLRLARGFRAARLPAPLRFPHDVLPV